MKLLPVFVFATVTACGAQMRWSHEPKQWTAKNGVVSATVDPGTDFWRVTHYRFIRDNGPFYFQEQAGDFEASVHVTGKYRELYHQAGLMMRVDEKNWIKTGIEYVNGVQNVSAVVTREFSDWAVVPRKDSRESVWLRLKSKGTLCRSSTRLMGASTRCCGWLTFRRVERCRSGWSRLLLGRRASRCSSIIFR
jgi:regulation of enolase protein 1 (concanavalin A-like superfamily)